MGHASYRGRCTRRIPRDAGETTLRTLPYPREPDAKPFGIRLHRIDLGRKRRLSLRHIRDIRVGVRAEYDLHLIRDHIRTSFKPMARHLSLAASNSASVIGRSVFFGILSNVENNSQRLIIPTSRGDTPFRRKPALIS